LRELAGANVLSGFRTQRRRRFGKSRRRRFGRFFSFFLGPAGVAAAPGRSAAAKASRLSTRASEQGAVAGTRASAAPADLPLLFFFFPSSSKRGRKRNGNFRFAANLRAGFFMGRDS